VRVKVPAPVLVSAPEVAVLAPEMVTLFVVISNVPVAPAVSVKFRSVLAVAPVYCSVPLFKTRLAAAGEACPKLPATPPLPMVATDKMPPLIVVVPV